MSSLIEDKKLLKAYIKGQDKIRNIMRKVFDRESVYNEKKIKNESKILP